MKAQMDETETDRLAVRFCFIYIMYMKDERFTTGETLAACLVERVLYTCFRRMPHKFHPGWKPVGALTSPVRCLPRPTARILPRASEDARPIRVAKPAAFDLTVSLDRLASQVREPFHVTKLEDNVPWSSS